ncbi:plasminogen-like isoform X2 [Brienomyrus brachyistius]|uniref:plasminogen-like isoform X2 n=1 Tax=Brienomyrus brachyistius TaxID=42636 RepID=UPI0020B333C8|nr:plasminogen-like isoform X2 [Brienomyrus brachyistius]
MAACKASILLCSLLCAGTASFLDEYIKMEGGKIYSDMKKEYHAETAFECALKCNEEHDFTCRSFLYIEMVEKCTTVSTNSKMETVQHDFITVMYEKKEYLAECKNGVGSDYRGSISKTKSGKTCQRWNLNYPHKTGISPLTHPDSNLEYNFCRNPDGDSNGPWCYTTDPDTRWEHCNIRDCSVSVVVTGPEECMHCSGDDYQGRTSTTENGYTCQRWDSQMPHSHGYFPDLIPEKHLEENYCRNPDGETQPWCFTTSSSKRWDYCSIPRCANAPPTVVEERMCVTGDGREYRGTVSVTKSGRTCQMWDSQVPHKHSLTPEYYPCKGLTLNYCRNPNNERMPWCYTTDPNTRWEHCKVPSCGDEPSPTHVPVLQPVKPSVHPVTDCYKDNGMSYRGSTSETIGGRQCQVWSSTSPHFHKKTPGNYPKADLTSNFCRNPDGDIAPWCYTTDPSVRWEYCRVERCPEQPVGGTALRPRQPNPEAGEALDCKDGNGHSYRGPMSVTSSGVTCQAWSSVTPHQHAAFTPETHPDKGLESNQCRNPDNDSKGPWCYTMDPNKKWDYCDIPDCGSQ